MNSQERAKIIERAVNTFGPEKQFNKCMEECAELIQALAKAQGADNSDEYNACGNHVREEIADVQIMLEQMRLICGGTEEWEHVKLKRLKEKMDNRAGCAEARPKNEPENSGIVVCFLGDAEKNELGQEFWSAFEAATRKAFNKKV